MGPLEIISLGMNPGAEGITKSREYRYIVKPGPYINLSEIKDDLFANINNPLIEWTDTDKFLEFYGNQKNHLNDGDDSIKFVAFKNNLAFDISCQHMIENDSISTTIKKDKDNNQKVIMNFKLDAKYDTSGKTYEIEFNDRHELIGMMTNPIKLEYVSPNSSTKEVRYVVFYPEQGENTNIQLIGENEFKIEKARYDALIWDKNNTWKLQFVEINGVKPDFDIVKLEDSGDSYDDGYYRINVKVNLDKDDKDNESMLYIEINTVWDQKTQTRLIEWPFSYGTDIYDLQDDQNIATDKVHRWSVNMIDNGVNKLDIRIEPNNYETWLAMEEVFWEYELNTDSISRFANLDEFGDDAFGDEWQNEKAKYEDLVQDSDLEWFEQITFNESIVVVDSNWVEKDISFESADKFDKEFYYAREIVVPDGIWWTSVIGKLIFDYEGNPMKIVGNSEVTVLWIKIDFDIEISQWADKEVDISGFMDQASMVKYLKRVAEIRSVMETSINSGVFDILDTRWELEASEINEYIKINPFAQLWKWWVVILLDQERSIYLNNINMIPKDSIDFKLCFDNFKLVTSTWTETGYLVVAQALSLKWQERWDGGKLPKNSQFDPYIVKIIDGKLTLDDKKARMSPEYPIFAKNRWTGDISEFINIQEERELETRRIYDKQNPAIEYQNDGQNRAELPVKQVWSWTQHDRKLVDVNQDIEKEYMLDRYLTENNMDVSDLLAPGIDLDIVLDAFSKIMDSNFGKNNIDMTEKNVMPIMTDNGYVAYYLYKDKKWMIRLKEHTQFYDKAGDVFNHLVERAEFLRSVNNPTVNFFDRRNPIKKLESDATSGWELTLSTDESQKFMQTLVNNKTKTIPLTIDLANEEELRLSIKFKKWGKIKIGIESSPIVQLWLNYYRVSKVLFVNGEFVIEVKKL